jgi:LysR family glycine cleavage system transcriptional activator
MRKTTQSFPHPGLRVRSLHHLCATAGQGIALIRDIYAVDDIASGRLVLALDCPWPTEFAYYAVTLPDALQRKPVRRFIDWLQEEMG